MSKKSTEEGSKSRTIEILYKAPVRESYTPNKYGKYYRYLKGIDVQTKEPVDFGTVFDDLEEEGLNPSIYDWVNFVYDVENQYKVNKSYDKVFLEAGFKIGESKIVCKDWKNWSKVGHREMDAAITLYFQYLTYGDGWARDDELGISISDEDVPFDFTHMLNQVRSKVGLDGWIKISGNSRVARKRITRKGKDEWIDVPVFIDDTKIEIDGYELGNMKSALKQYRVSEAYTQFIALLRKELAEGRFVSLELATGIAADFGIETEIDVVSELRQLVFKKNYDYHCFEFLNELTTDDANIFFGSHGFIFEINGHQVWEVPIAGVATYIFNGKMNSAELATKVEVTPRNVILKTEAGEWLGYKSRVIHPKVSEEDSEEEDKYFARWCRDVKEAIGLGE
jgi:hypothetical protein